MLHSSAPRIETSPTHYPFNISIFESTPLIYNLAYAIYQLYIWPPAYLVSVYLSTSLPIYLSTSLQPHLCNISIVYLITCLPGLNLPWWSHTWKIRSPGSVILILLPRRLSYWTKIYLVINYSSWLGLFISMLPLQTALKYVWLNQALV